MIYIVVMVVAMDWHGYIDRGGERDCHTQKHREDRERDRDRETHTEKQRKNHTETHTQRQTYTQRDTHTQRQRQTKTEKDRDKESEPERDKERERERDAESLPPLAPPPYWAHADSEFTLSPLKKRYPKQNTAVISVHFLHEPPLPNNMQGCQAPSSQLVGPQPTENWGLQPGSAGLIQTSRPPCWSSVTGGSWQTRGMKTPIVFFTGWL